MYLTLKQLQTYLGDVSTNTALSFKNEVLFSLGKKHTTNKQKKSRITIYDVAKYHNIPLTDVLTTLKPL